ncbi:IFM3 protein, partial [Podargus strigoides]|nr:IFM3 protein [Podargus strigoides]NXX10756.1 IFM3 protein [Podargus strigoides]
ATAFGSTAPFVRPEPVPNPRDFVLWSFFNTIFCNALCLGFIALTYSVKARDRKIAQDPSGAASFGRTAKHINIAAFCLGTVAAIICIVVVVMWYNTLMTIRT